jgi:hypothetical protein
MPSKPNSPAAAAAHRIVDELEQRLAPFATAPKRRRAASKSSAAKAAARSGPAALVPVAGPAQDDNLRVLYALTQQAANLRATMVADLERLIAVATAPGAPPAGDDECKPPDGAGGSTVSAR